MHSVPPVVCYPALCSIFEAVRSMLLFSGASSPCPYLSMSTQNRSVSLRVPFPPAPANNPQNTDTPTACKRLPLGIQTPEDSRIFIQKPAHGNKAINDVNVVAVCDHLILFFLSWLKAVSLWKAINISFNLFVNTLSFHPVQFR